MNVDSLLGWTDGRIDILNDLAGIAGIEKKLVRRFLNPLEALKLAEDVDDIEKAAPLDKEFG